VCVCVKHAKYRAITFSSERIAFLYVCVCTCMC